MSGGISAELICHFTRMKDIPEVTGEEIIKEIEPPDLEVHEIVTVCNAWLVFYCRNYNGLS
jgi:hypothetical protein